jgi:hypothetical protein
MRFPMNYQFIPLKERKTGKVYTVINYLTTTNLNGSVVRTCYVCKHDFCGQDIISEECEATIARGEPVAPVGV